MKNQGDYGNSEVRRTPEPARAGGFTGQPSGKAQTSGLESSDLVQYLCPKMINTRKKIREGEKYNND